MRDICDYPGCERPATIQCGMLGCLHDVCDIHGNGSVEVSTEECVPICWGCDGKGWPSPHEEEKQEWGTVL